MTETSVVDFETEAINQRPNYPPKPVGVAIRWPNGKSEYLAWGHKTKNNCDIATARSKLKEAYAVDRIIFHHSAFDIDVSESHLGLKPQGRVEDTLFLAFLKDPFAPELGLKELGAKDLGMPAEEQDKLRDWIIEHVPAAKKKPSSWAEHMAEAPGKLTGQYAIGDTTRTYRIFKKYLPEIDRRGMRDAYERELAVAPISLEMERSGVRVDRRRLKECRDVLIRMDKDVLKRIAKRLRLDWRKMKSDENPKGFNLNSGVQLADAMIRANKLSAIVKTPTGKVKTSMDVLRATCSDQELLNMLGVHSVTDTYLGTFIGPWLEQSALAGGRLLPKFNQVRGYDAGGGGARTGRYSSSQPNLQNVSADVAESKNKLLLLFMQKFLREQYEYDFIGLRDFFIPDEGCIICPVDYDQQELHILAHFERGTLLKAYKENPELDVHQFISDMLRKDFEIDLPRKAVKTIVFGILYGMGLDKLAKSLEITKKKAKRARDAVFALIPGIPRIMRELKNLAYKDLPMRTWGGREYYCEEPKFVKSMGRVMEFSYRQFNYRIQGSAADMTKQGMVNVRQQLPKVRIAMQVHDELICMVPSVKYGPKIARAMCDMKFRLPMTASPKYSRESWARAKEPTKMTPSEWRKLAT